MNLGTHTAGSFPLQVPDGITSTDELFHYLNHDWKLTHAPVYAPGTYRVYSNLTIGMLGMVTASSLKASFDDAVTKLFSELGMTNTYIHVPVNKMGDYAQGYNKKDQPVRLNPAFLSAQAYGVKSGSADLIRFVEANMQLVPLNKNLQQAITKTHTGYFKADNMTQDLIWEQYPYPITLKELLKGNSDKMMFKSMKVTRLTPPSLPKEKVFINKTGSTNGFAAYVAFIPEKKIGLVLLANKAYPVAPRVTLAYQILTGIEDLNASKLKNTFKAPDQKSLITE